jgi:hypothetical protein
MNERVLDREIRLYPVPKKGTGADGAPIRQTLGISAVQSCVTAIVDLWSFQKSKGI